MKQNNMQEHYDVKNDLNLSWLKTFVVVVQEENLTKAGKVLGMSQPAVSKQMDELERILGKPLLERSKKKVTMTREGLFYYTKVQEILNLIEQAQSCLAPREIAGDIYLGGGESCFMGRMVELFARLKEQHPLLRLHLFSGDAPTVTERLDKGFIDMAVLINPKKQEGIEYIDLKATDRYGLLVRKDDPIASRRSISLKEAARLPLLFSTRMYEESRYGTWKGIQHSSLNVVGTYNLINNCAYMVEQGPGYAECTANLYNTQGTNLTFLPFEPRVEGRLFLALKNYQGLSKAAQVFVEFVKRELLG